jgi:putative aldouronate transport system substrate-binding protein
VNKRSTLILLLIVIMCSGIVSACSTKGDELRKDIQTLPSGGKVISLTLNQVGDVPEQGNEVERLIEDYTNTSLNIQWIPLSAYDEKINIMIASGELPKLLKVNYNPTIVSAIQSDVFWEIGPYLKDYPNLSAQQTQFYENISVNGKIYGVPLFRELGRASIHYRKDWFDSLELQVPVTMDDWYRVIRDIGQRDPDKNGKSDTYGLLLDKNYNQGTMSILTRLTVAQGGPNKWKIENGNFVPEFMTEEFLETMKLFRRLYQEKLINSDFAVVDANEIDRVFEAGRVGMRITGGNAQTILDKLVKVDPNAVVDAEALTGPLGRRLPGESGNSGFLAIPKSQVKDETELRDILQFIDKLMDVPMATLLVKGIEGRHYIDRGSYTEPMNRNEINRLIKPYRDNLPHRGELYNVAKPSRESELFLKNQQITRDNERFVVLNPALNLQSATFSDKGEELDLLITDAETRFIMGKIDEDGWKSEVERWRQHGGARMMQEYRDSYQSGSTQ